MACSAHPERASVRTMASDGVQDAMTRIATLMPTRMAAYSRNLRRSEIKIRPLKIAPLMALSQMRSTPFLPRPPAAPAGSAAWQADVLAIREQTYQRFPFFRSTRLEQRLLFGTPGSGELPALTILPTAKYYSDAA